MVSSWFLGTSISSRLGLIFGGVRFGVIRHAIDFSSLLRPEGRKRDRDLLVFGPWRFVLLAVDR